MTRKGSLTTSARHTSLAHSDTYSKPAVRLESTCSGCRHDSHPNCGRSRSDSQRGTSDEQPVRGMEQQILPSGWLQASVNLDADRGHPNGKPESRDSDRSGPDWSATSEANPTSVCQSADSPPYALPGSRHWPQDNRGVPDRHRTQHSLDAHQQAGGII